MASADGVSDLQASTNVDASPPLPSLDAARNDKKLQYELVAKLIEDDEASGLKEGEYYYVLDKTWFRKWEKYSKPEDEDALGPGPIVNSAILEESGQVRPRLQENVDFVILNKETWTALFSWYGGGPEIRRRCVAPSHNKRMTSIELRPLCVKVIQSSQVKKAVPIFISKYATLQEFIDEARKVMVFDRSNIRVFDFHNGNKLKELTKMSRPLDDAQILDQQLMLIEEKKKSGKWPKDSIYKVWGQKGSSSMYSNRSPTDPGKTGLVNIGNTCFMNSSLQCLGAAVPLVDHFMTKRFRDEINTDNPLGTKGELSEAYATVLTELWSSQSSVCDPREFKRALAKFAPQFTGYNQQDSQELMTFVLDGLHEDLNRIKKKPYVEQKDSDGRPDDVVAKEAWSGYTARNDSIIVDNFMGLLKSTLTCPNNGRVAVKFDPFMFLTLQLPIDNSRRIKFTYHSLDFTKPPKKLSVVVNKEGSVKEAKQALAAAVGVADYKRIALMDVFKGYIYAEFTDNDDVGSIKESDDVHAYEVEISETSSAQELGAGLAPAPELVHIVLLHKKLYKPTVKETDLFGTPIVLSVDRNITYRQLYSKVVDVLKPNLKESVASDISLEEGEKAEDAAPVAQASDDFDEIASRNQAQSKTYDPIKNRWSVNSIPKEPMFGGSFTLIPITNRGTDKGALFANNDKPLNLKEKDHVAILWTKQDKKKYIDMEKLKFVEKDSSVSEEPSDSRVKRKSADVLPLSECLRLYNVQEQLGEDDKWYCPECKDHVQAFKKIEIWSAPKILIVHLKRFNYRGKYHFRDRLDHLVEFPLEGLDMSPYVLSKSDVPPVYDLFAVSNHYGSMGGGHYTAFARHRDDGKWHLYDDSSVREVSDPNSIISEAAYLLLYRRRDVPWTPFNRNLEEKDSDTEDSDDSDADDEDEEATTTTATVASPSSQAVAASVDQNAAESLRADFQAMSL